MLAPDGWDDFQVMFAPLIEELMLLTIALTRLAAAYDSIRTTYRDFDQWLYQYNANEVK